MTTRGTGVVVKDLVHRVTACPSPNIPVLVCQKESLFSEAE